MIDLGPDARDLLAAARGGDDPTSDDADRVRARIGARLAAGAAVGTATALATKTTAAKAAASAGAAGVTSKIAVAAIVVGGATATTAVALHPEVVQLAPHVAAPPPQAKRVAQTPLAVRGPTIAAAGPSSEPAAEAPGTFDRAPQPAPVAKVASVAAVPTVAAVARARAAEPASAAEPKVAAAEPADPLAEEAALLRRAREALARGDAATALARVDEHATRFPGGTLSVEREAARVHALCASGRPGESRAAATAFVAENPRSPLAPSVRRACATRE